MQAGEANHWEHEVWKFDDERRFRLTLGISVALHALFLLFWNLPPPVWRAADAAVLTVVLRGAAPVVPVSPPVPEQAREASVLVQNDPRQATFSVPAKPPIPVPAVPAMPQPSPAIPGELGRRASKLNPGRASNATPAPVGISVMLVIGSDGRANQIYWDKLPALTDEQLRRVERVIRARIYRPGQTVTEVFDVREFLKLQPARSEDSSPPTPESEPVGAAM